MKDYLEQRVNGESREYYYPNLISKMKEKKVSIIDLASYLKRNYYQISRKINGRGNFTVEECREICTLLGDSFENLFFCPYKK